jgi:hypothetical protein
MSDIDKRIEDRIRAFTEELRDLLREAAIEAITTALSSPLAAVGNSESDSLERTAKHRRISKSLRSAPSLASRRSPQQMAHVVDLLYAQITAQPGQTIEQIAKAIGMTPRQLSRPVRQLLAARRIKKTGIKRYTRYFPVHARPSKPSSPNATSKSRTRSRKRPAR